jgi:hypothetical protein
VRVRYWRQANCVKVFIRAYPAQENEERTLRAAPSAKDVIRCANGNIAIPDRDRIYGVHRRCTTPRCATPPNLARRDNPNDALLGGPRCEPGLPLFASDRQDVRQSPYDANAQDRPRLSIEAQAQQAEEIRDCCQAGRRRHRQTVKQVDKDRRITRLRERGY